MNVLLKLLLGWGILLGACSINISLWFKIPLIVIGILLIIFINYRDLVNTADDIDNINGLIVACGILQCSIVILSLKWLFFWPIWLNVILYILTSLIIVGMIIYKVCISSEINPEIDKSNDIRGSRLFLDLSERYWLKGVREKNDKLNNICKAMKMPEMTLVANPSGKIFDNISHFDIFFYVISFISSIFIFNFASIWNIIGMICCFLIMFIAICNMFIKLISPSAIDRHIWKNICELSSYAEICSRVDNSDKNKSNLL